MLILLCTNTTTHQLHGEEIIVIYRKFIYFLELHMVRTEKLMENSQRDTKIHKMSCLIKMRMEELNLVNIHLYLYIYSLPLRSNIKCQKTKFLAIIKWTNKFPSKQASCCFLYESKERETICYGIYDVFRG